jgi:hypothetical protein
MKDYYKILNIDRYATKGQIKKAYRDLALKYHPDKAGAMGSHQKFTEINEAYQVLSREDHRENYNFIYDYEHLNRKRQQADTIFKETVNWGSNLRGKRGWRTPFYAKDDENVDLKPYIKSVRIISILSFLFTFLIILDYFLPKTNYEQTVLTKLTTYKSMNTIIVETEDFEFPLNFRYAKMIRSGDKAIVSLSPIFGIQSKLTVESRMDKYVFNPHYSIYNIFAFFLVILLVTSYIGLYQNPNNPELIFSAGVANVFLSLLVMYLIFSR